MKTAHFNTGFLTSTIGINEEMQNNSAFAEFCQNSFERHSKEDWGDLDEEDLESNNFALENKERILSSYRLPKNISVDNESKIWIITEWDRSVTTILFPSEY